MADELRALGERYTKQWEQLKAFLGNAFGTADSGLNLNGYDVIVTLGKHPDQKEKTLVYAGKDGKGDIFAVDSARLTDTSKGLLNILDLHDLSHVGARSFQSLASKQAVALLNGYYDMNPMQAESMVDTSESYPGFSAVMTAIGDGPRGKKMKPEALSPKLLQTALSEVDVVACNAFCGSTPSALKPEQARAIRGANEYMGKIAEASARLEIAEKIPTYRADLQRDIIESPALSTDQKVNMGKVLSQEPPLSDFIHGLSASPSLMQKL